MSTKIKKKSTAAVTVHTSMRNAPVCLLLGVVLIVLGVLALLSQVWRGGSTVLDDVSRALQGLCGPLCLLMPLWMLYAGIKLLFSLEHKVAMRDVWLLLLLYAVGLAFQTLITMISGRGSLMAYIGQVNEQRVVAHPASYGAYLKQAYALGGQLGGGLMGMLLAYPLWSLLGQVFSAVMLALAAVGLIIWLFRINVSELIEQLFAKQEGRRVKRAASQETAQMDVPPYETVQDLPMEEMHPGQQVQYEQQPAPINSRYTAAAMYSYNGNQADQPRANPQQTGGQMFYTVSNEQIYDEPFADTAYNQPVEPEYVDVQPVMEGPQEEMPWYDEVVPVEEMVDEPVIACEPEAQKVPELVKEDTAKKEEQDEKQKVKPTPVQETAVRAKTASTWMEQLNKRRRETEMAPADDQLTMQVTSGHAKPVFTGNAVELTGERIPIRSHAKRETETEAPSAAARMDGMTSKPKTRVIGAPVMIDYKGPPMHFLAESQNRGREDHSKEDNDRAVIIEETLKSFNVQAKVMQIMHGPAITRFAIQIAPGIRVARVLGMADNLALNLATKHVRMEAPIQGTNYIGIEVPNAKVTPVLIREVLESENMRFKSSPLAVALGKDIAGSAIICGLEDMPHLLIAGSTGSGKSVCIQSIVSSIMYRASPDDVRMIMIDPKQVELKMYDGIPHLLIPVVTDMRKAAGALSWAVQEMEERYTKISDMGERNLEGYNGRVKREERLPSIVIIIDELADLMDVARKDVEESIRRLAAKARAAGIYMVLATQRPSVDVLTGVIKNNIPSRIAFQVTSGTDSRTILDLYGAEKLVGKGDMLYKPAGAAPLRVQGCFITAEECRNIADYLRKHYQNNYDPNIMEHLENTQDDDKKAADRDDVEEGEDGQVDELLHEVIQMAIEEGQTSTSMLQRRLRIGYARAGRLVDEMERRGIVSTQDGSKPRKTLITREQYYEMFADDEI